MEGSAFHSSDNPGYPGIPNSRYIVVNDPYCRTNGLGKK